MLDMVLSVPSNCGGGHDRGRAQNGGPRLRADELSTVAYSDSETQRLLTNCARGSLHRFRDFDHRRLTLGVRLEIANVLLRPRDTLNSFSHQS
jgi:hypothetical protein